LRPSILQESDQWREISEGVGRPFIGLADQNGGYPHGLSAQNIGLYIVADHPYGLGMVKRVEHV
jgi:hypothetical protein